MNWTESDVIKAQEEGWKIGASGKTILAIPSKDDGVFKFNGHEEAYEHVVHHAVEDQCSVCQKALGVISLAKGNGGGGDEYKDKYTALILDAKVMMDYIWEEVALGERTSSFRRNFHDLADELNEASDQDLRDAGFSPPDEAREEFQKWREA